MTKFNPGDYVKIKNTSKSKYKEAIGVVERYCNGHYRDICRVKLWRNHTVQIFDRNLEIFDAKENNKCKD
jgi:hypothetical protein